MTLLPIIYTSLLIFSAFLLFVIMISYASYKMKGGRNQVKRFDRLEPQLQPIVNTVPVRRIASVQVTQTVYPQKYPLILKKNDDRINNQYRNRGTKRIVPENQHVNQERLTKNISSNRLSYEKSARSESQSRIEIMNTSERYNQSSYYQQSPVRQPKSAQSLTDVNLLNYYSDRNDTGFVSLTAF